MGKYIPRLVRGAFLEEDVNSVTHAQHGDMTCPIPYHFVVCCLCWLLLFSCTGRCWSTPKAIQWTLDYPGPRLSGSRTEIIARVYNDLRMRVVAVDKKITVQQFSGWLSKNRDENPRMRALLVGILN